MFVFYSIKFYGGKAGKQVPKCRVLLCFKPLRRNVLPAFYSLRLDAGFFLFVCFSSVATSPIEKESFPGPDHGRKNSDPKTSSEATPVNPS